ncbi:TPA: hypothetical protein RQJ47_004325 [Vibrio vulnificus]|nr:hypothetical protein [Vibrio vulnificus]HDY8211201.1 hypothetical protein [Vibrio vulnificus]
MNFLVKFGKEVAWTLIGFYLSVVFIAVADSSEKNFIDILNSLGSFISAAGAIVAIYTLIHLINDKKQSQVDSNVQAANYAFFILHRQFEFLKQFSSRLKPYEDLEQFQRSMQFPTTDFPEELRNKINPKELLFILGTDDPEVLVALDNFQRNMNMLHGVVKKRHSLYEEYHGVMAEAGLDNGYIKRSQVADLMGQARLNSLMMRTDEIFEVTKFLESDFTKLSSRLYKVVSLKYPDNKFIKLTAA